MAGRDDRAGAGCRCALPRASALVAIGVLLIAHPQLALQVAVTVVGVYLLYKGIEALLRLVYQPPAEAGATRRRPAPRRPPLAARRGRRASPRC